MKISTLLSLGAAALAVAAGCSREPSAPILDAAAPPARGEADALSRPAPADAAAPVAEPDDGLALIAGEAPTLRILDAGLEPRRRLSPSLSVGAAERAKVTLSMTVATTLDGRALPVQTLPEVTLSLALSVVAVAPDGSAVCALEITDAAVHDSGADAAAGTVARVREGLAAVAGLEGEVSIGPGGLTRGAKLSPLEGAPEVVKLLEGFEQAMGQIGIPLPTEPVGAGARWRLTQALGQLDARVEQRLDVALVREAGGRVATTLTLSQSLVEAGEGKGPRLEALSGSGVGEATLALDRALPVYAEARFRTRLKMTLDGARAMEMDMSAAVKIVATDADDDGRR